MKKFLRKHWLSVTLVFLCAFFAIFFFVIPIKRTRIGYCYAYGPGNNVTNTREGCVVTCEAYDTPDGLSPKTDKYEEYHLIFGQLEDFQVATQTPGDKDSKICAGGLKVESHQLYL